MRRVARILGFGLLVFAVLGIAGFLVYARPQPLLPEAAAALASTAEVEVSTAGNDLVFRPTAAPPRVGLILYPGGKVPPSAYAPAAREIAATAGVLVEIVDVPFNFAVFDIDAATRVMAREPGIATWAVGGHSLGGAMAAQFAASHPGVVSGLVFWASYSASDLSATPLRVVSIYGSLDGGAATFTSADNRAKLPADATFVEIAGANHEQMGWYTGQPNDPPAAITRADQQAHVVRLTATFLSTLGAAPGG
jgi:dienelactone hydrolase